ncbi:hypothetical protein [Parasulfitobacter algicola]|uniref:Porin domain-containing protein n=1 Tax=Parasulfitobacter algicola TaxID=2614809 RepID=A0ABX2IN68_9RHOB|nr:hypothetical protein [Sulfitobacter algicola]NSX54318.1 hypothetical protein [Sulfitobacter algicola]
MTGFYDADIKTNANSDFVIGGLVSLSTKKNMATDLSSSDIIVIKAGDQNMLSLNIGFDTSNSSLDETTITPSIAWSPDAKITLKIGSEQKLNALGDMSLTIGTAFAF